MDTQTTQCRACPNVYWHQIRAWAWNIQWAQWSMLKATTIWLSWSLLLVFKQLLVYSGQKWWSHGRQVPLWYLKQYVPVASPFNKMCPPSPGLVPLQGIWICFHHSPLSLPACSAHWQDQPLGLRWTRWGSAGLTGHKCSPGWSQAGWHIVLPSSP